MKPIKNESDHAAALARIEGLMDAEPDTPKGDELDVLVTLVAAYEARHHPIDPPDPVEAIIFRLEQSGLTRKDLEPYIGPRSRVSEILNRRRRLTRQMAWRLHRGLGISAESLLRPYELEPA